MSVPKSYVDGFLIAWEAGEYEAQLKTMYQMSHRIEPNVMIASASGRGGLSKAATGRAQAVRDRLARTVRKVPEVMVKITSSCKGMKQIGRHIDYISRKGDIDVEDQDGFTLTGRDALKELKEDWRMGGPEEIGADSDRRDTLNIIFSMPAHTDEVSMKRAVRAFSAAEFNGHQYVFAYHTQATDPDPNPPAHPHVHLTVKTQARSGRRLNPRKADLQRWREDFAAQLRAHGIEANATTRLARLKREPGRKRSALAIAERGEGDQQTKRNGKSRSLHSQNLEADRRSYYALLGQVLTQSELPADRALGAEIARHLAAAEQSRPALTPDRER